MKNEWFQVDKGGLAKLVDERGKEMVLFELIQNAWDTGATMVDVELEAIPGRPAAILRVRDDDANGFANLSHTYTLFAESEKKGDSSKRGFMNLGEKLVLALCRHASVKSTTGSVTFHEDGTMTRGRACTERGSVFEGELKMTREELSAVHDAFWRLIPPPTCRTTLNGETLKARTPTVVFEAQLPTRIANAEGYMRPTKRICKVEVYEVADGDVAWLYEMGIPVVETGDTYHLNVLQKVPVNMNRDNVPPSYLQRLRAETLNKTAKLLYSEEAKEAWVTNALQDPNIDDEAVARVLEHRFGAKRVIYDPTDLEANHNAVAAGYSVIHGGSLPAAAWDAVRRSGAALPAGRVMPTPKPCSGKEIPEAEWTVGMSEVANICRWFSNELGVRRKLRVMFVTMPGNFIATWGAAGLEWNVQRLGHKFFEHWPKNAAEMLNTMIHEFAHESAASHLDEKFHGACSRLGGLLAVLVHTRSAEIPHFSKVCSEVRGA